MNYTQCHLNIFILLFFLIYFHLCVQEANTSPSLVTLKVDPDGFFLYWSGGTTMVSNFPFCLYLLIPVLSCHLLLFTVLSDNPLFFSNLSLWKYCAFDHVTQSFAGILLLKLGKILLSGFLLQGHKVLFILFFSSPPNLYCKT